MTSPSYLSRLKESFYLWRETHRLVGGWQRECKLTNATPHERLQRVVIVPSDPWTLVGAKGDEAMMQSVVQQLKAAEPGLVVGVVTDTPQAAQAAAGMGFEALPVWNNVGFLPMLKGILAFKPDVLLVLGADVMDGYYNPRTSLRLLAVADLCARSGVRAVLLGFSFNAKPAPVVLKMFDGVSRSLNINVRDPISLRRFQAMTRATPRLVADSAFMLLPDADCPTVAEAATWAAGRRQAGDVVMGFNIHPMLIPHHTDDNVASLNRSSIAALSELLDAQPVSVALISHDYRGRDGDDACLKEIAQALSARYPGRIYYPQTQLSAGHLKALAGLMDGVVTGRMHLAIAALGMTVPVAALTYQDKFQGLFEHFGLPQSLLLPPAKAQDPVELARLLTAFVGSLASLKAQVQARWPAVQELSRDNLAGLR
jgi:polysaccharide pyruvyl transferase WcaK-like protein